MPFTSGSPTGLSRLQMSTPGVIPPTIWNQLIAIVRAGVLLSGNGYRVKQLAHGVILDIDSPKSAAAPAPAQYQMLSLKLTAPGASTYALRLQPGDVNGIVFPTVAGTSMWQMVATTVGSVTTYDFPTLTITKGDVVFLTLSVAAGVIITAIIDHGTPPAESDTTTSWVIGTCDGTTGAWTQLWTGPLRYQAVASYWEAGARLVAHLWNSNS